MSAIIWIGIAFLFGTIAKLIRLPPLIGYLSAGFLLPTIGQLTTELDLSTNGIDDREALNQFADLGVTLLLFTIGLKLKVKNLLRVPIWGTGFGHMAIITIAMSGLLFLLSSTGWGPFSGLDFKAIALIGFALSFSSTVFVVKVLEEKAAMNSFYGTLAIGILIIQDIAAVIYLAASTGKIPSPWALALLIGLYPLHRLMKKFLNFIHKGELLLLFGLFIALGGAILFESFGIKGDLGALLLGIMLSKHKYATNLAKELFNFKDLFLVGFFLSIGLSGLPDSDIILTAILISLILPLKALLFFLFLTKFRVTSRTAILSSAILFNYSEFGLIVAKVGVDTQVLSPKWLTIIALALAISFLYASPLSANTQKLIEFFIDKAKRFESKHRLPEEINIDPGDVNIIIIGMGRLGTGAYDEFLHQDVDKIVGFDNDPSVVKRHLNEGRHSILANSVDPDFWHRFCVNHPSIQMVLLSMPETSNNLFAAQQLRANKFEGKVFATVKYKEDEATLKENGVDYIFNFYISAGAGFAIESLTALPKKEGSMELCAENIV
ncbi:putative glutathione-regulated potassium-efflux system protein (K(+)/H(+) antiporter) [Lentisphaera araneosa HTCC2155]|jgi:glutathione-regulated potassium-efflux system ancillary protein KefC|uniref:Putative glutathione-regulated potassium-efflux system protein ( K(+)/H(+) antiporter) n=1 Tax=Lentisphaera araneosa HTCC2155 TaxID=313628 RepID=A6DKH9_9BACT|nr:cation:proton antiporter family protein [Lentisphaera araneosa]EDM27877.1 putative glutathione-regulated potassium-efflux system protein (K(+)/H(+) antiporter) [Lentisphaera araneosa HTCC2155]